MQGVRFSERNGQHLACIFKGAGTGGGGACGKGQEGGGRHRVGSSVRLRVLVVQWVL